MNICIHSSTRCDFRLKCSIMADQHPKKSTSLNMSINDYFIAFDMLRARTDMCNQGSGAFKNERKPRHGCAKSGQHVYSKKQAKVDDCMPSKTLFASHIISLSRGLIGPYSSWVELLCCSEHPRIFLTATPPLMQLRQWTGVKKAPKVKIRQVLLGGEKKKKPPKHRERASGSCWNHQAIDPTPRLILTASAANHYHLLGILYINKENIT